MHRVAIAVAVIATIALLLLVVLVSSVNRMIATQRDAILHAAQKAIGRPLTVDSITFTLWGGIGLRFTQARIADDPRFGPEPFLKAPAVTAHVKLQPLLHRELVLSSIDLQRPEIHLIRDAAGQWNYATLKPGCAGAACSASVAPAVVRVAVSTPPMTEPAPSFVISRVSIQDGTIVLDDRSQRAPQVIQVTQIDLRVRDLSASKPVAFILDMAFQRDTHNVHLEGTVGPTEHVPAVPIAIDGALGPLGPGDVRIDALHLTAAATKDAIDAAVLNGRAFEGLFAFTGQYALGRDGEAALRGDLKHINIARLLEVSGHDVAKQVEGAADVSVDVHSPAASVDRLSGRVVTDVKDGVIKDFNLVDEVLSRVTGLPGIRTLISTNVKPKYGRLFAEPQTRFDTLHGSFEIGEQRLRTDDLLVLATDYGVRASGWIGFNRDADIAGTLLMSKRFSDDVVAGVKEVRYLLDDNGQLAVPFRLRGKLGKAKPKPDSEYLAKLLARAVSHGAAKELLDSFLGGKDDKQPDGAAPRKSLEKSLRNLFGH